MTKSKRELPCMGLLITILCVLFAVGMAYCHRQHEANRPPAPSTSSDNL